MKPYLELFVNTGGNDVEELLHDESTTPFANVVRYLLIAAVRSQFDLLKRLKAKGGLTDALTPGNMNTWIEGQVLPDSALKASYETGAGKVICAVAEVDEALQAEGYPELCWSYVDVVPGVIIDRCTNSNITNHVVRWLPVARMPE